MRLPLALRIYGIAFGVVWCGVLAAGTVSGAVAGSLGALVPLAMLIVGGTFLVRMNLQSVRINGSTVIVRNILSTRRIDRADVEGVRLGRAHWPQAIGTAVILLTTDNRLVCIDVTHHSGILLGGRQRAEAVATDLRSWAGIG
jgi:hypothetical protein